MSEVTVVAKARARAGQEAALEAAIRECVEPTHREGGCIRYALHTGADDPSLFIIVERWASRAALETHLASQHVANLFMKAPHLVAAPPEIHILTPLLAGDPVKGKL